MRRICPISIIILAFFLRFYQLGANPPSLDWDEASLGYNAYSLLKTGRDEYGKALPVNLTSFGDFKPAAYVYLTIPAIALFGLNEFSVRLSSAIVGTIAVALTYSLVRELFRTEEVGRMKYEVERKNMGWSLGKNQSKPFRLLTSHFSLLTSLFLAISPWHIQFSRVAFEANLGLFWVILGILLFILGLRKPRILPFSSIALAFSLYSYHSTRLFVPLLLLGLFWYSRRKLLAIRGWFLTSIFILTLLLLPLINSLLTTESSARFQAVSQFRPDLALRDEIKRQEYDRQHGDFLGVLLHNRRVTYVKSILEGYLDHFDFSFLFIEGDQYIRHNAVGMGLLYLWSLPFILFGIVTVSQMKGLPRFVIFSWFFLAPVASALTKGTPHAVRALLFLPTYQLFTAVGLLAFLKYFGNYLRDHLKSIKNLIYPLYSGLQNFQHTRRSQMFRFRSTLPPSEVFLGFLKKITNSNAVGNSKIQYPVLRIESIHLAVVLAILIVFIGSIFYYLNLYFIHTPVETSQAWQYGYKQVVEDIKEKQNQYSHIIITNSYDQPYIYFLFYLQVDPSWYQKNWHGEISREFRAFDKYEFREIRWEEDKFSSNTLFVISPEEASNIPIDQFRPIEEVNFLDGSVAFYMIDS